MTKLKKSIYMIITISVLCHSSYFIILVLFVFQGTKNERRVLACTKTSEFFRFTEGMLERKRPGKKRNVQRKDKGASNEVYN